MPKAQNIHWFIVTFLGPTHKIIVAQIARAREARRHMHHNKLAITKVSNIDDKVTKSFQTQKLKIMLSSYKILCINMTNGDHKMRK